MPNPFVRFGALVASAGTTAGVWLKTLLSAAIGGAAGATVNFFTSANGNYTKIDWHALGITAGVGALIAVAHLLVPSPVAPNKN